MSKDIHIGYLCEHGSNPDECNFNPSASYSTSSCLYRQKFVCASIQAQVHALKEELGRLTGKVWVMTNEHYEQLEEKNNGTDEGTERDV